MREFVAGDGRRWSAAIHDGGFEGRPDAATVGWEAVVFDCGLAAQRLVFRPAGWLARAATSELEIALREAETIRTRWQPAGGD